MTKKSVQSIMNERVLLSQFTSPFIVNMHFAFQDRDTLYLVLDLMEGGDLRHHIGTRSFNEIQSSNSLEMQNFS
jgi:serum/glucocorticoid-regulated kinase 2